MILDLLPAPAAREQAVRDAYRALTAALSLPALLAAPATSQDIAFANLPLLRAHLMGDDALATLVAAINQRAADDLRSARPARWLLQHGEGWSGDVTMRVLVDELRADPLAMAFVEHGAAGLRVRAIGSDGRTVRCGPEAVWTNPLTVEAGGGTIAVDLASPVARELIATKPDFSLLDDAEAPHFHDKLTAAIGLIRSTWPEMVAAVGANVGLIVASATTAPRDTKAHLHGSTMITFPAVISMNDFHRSHIPIEDLAENVVHETIHNIIFDLERIDPWFDVDALEELRANVPSPWSARVLEFYSFFHSLFVFTAVGEWWQRVAASDAAGGTTRRHARNRLADLRRRFAAVRDDRARYGLVRPPLSARGRDWLAAHVDHPDHWSRAHEAVARV